VLARRGARIYHVPERLFSSISDVQTSQGILALADVPPVSLAGFVLPPNPLILCACGLQDPGNLGTLVRTAAAAGACLVCTMTGTVSARMPKTIRATAGAFFRIPVIEHLQPAAFFSFCRTRAIVPFLADVRGRQPYDLADYRRPCAILVGNEARGVDWPPGAEIQTVCIPMAPGAESLNVGTAGALVMYEAFRQRTPWSNL
jgi:TrmH family RNA methyltransferase